MDGECAAAGVGGAYMCVRAGTPGGRCAGARRVGGPACWRAGRGEGAKGIVESVPEAWDTGCCRRGPFSSGPPRRTSRSAVLRQDVHQNAATLLHTRTYERAELSWSSLASARGGLNPVCFEGKYVRKRPTPSHTHTQKHDTPTWLSLAPASAVPRPVRAPRWIVCEARASDVRRRRVARLLTLSAQRTCVAQADASLSPGPKACGCIYIASGGLTLAETYRNSASCLTRAQIRFITFHKGGIM